MVDKRDALEVLEQLFEATSTTSPCELQLCPVEKPQTRVLSHEGCNIATHPAAV